MTTKTWLALGAAATALLAASQAAAAGFFVQEQSARAVGRAFSGEVADTGPASLWWNPASIMGLEGRGEIYLGAHAIDVNATVADTGSTIRRPTVPATLPVGGIGVQKNPIDFGFVPNLSGAWKLNERVAVGLAVNTPFNFTTRYDVGGFTRYQALKSMLMNLDVQPTVAVRVTPNLDVGLGVDASYANAKLTNALPNLSPLAADGYQRLSGDGWDYGWNVGARAHNEMGSLAVSYRSQIKHRLDGRIEVAGLLGPAAAANVDQPGEANFTTPWILSFGGKFNANERLTLNAQVQRIGWSQFDAIRVSFAGRFAVTPQNYHNTTTWAVGADYKLNDRLTWRAGLQRDPTPTRVADRTARVPDSDRWIYATGGTLQTGRGALDFSVAYIDFASARFASDASAFGGTPLNTPIAMNGTIDGRGLVGSVGWRMSF